MTTNSAAYSSMKILHHAGHIEAMRRGEQPAPIHVQLIPTNRCPHRCNFCAYRMPGYSSNETFDPRQEIDFWKLAEIVDDCEGMGVRAIEITGGGEPTWHPQFLDLCDAILHAEIDLGLVTNGARWSDAHSRMLSHSKWVRFSFDAGCAETYAMLRGVDTDAYSAVRENVRSLVAHRTQVASGPQQPIIGVGFVVSSDNWSEVVEATRRAKEDGADNIRLSAVFQNEGPRYFDSFGVDAAKLCREAESLADERFRVFNFFTDRVHDLTQGPPDYEFCGFQQLCTYIGADLNVYRCCVVAYNHLGLLGSIRDRSFKDFWRSAEKQAKMAGHNARTCPRCQVNAKNALIAYAVEPNPQHVNFL